MTELADDNTPQDVQRGKEESFDKTFTYFEKHRKTGQRLSKKLDTEIWPDICQLFEVRGEIVEEVKKIIASKTLTPAQTKLLEDYIVTIKLLPKLPKQYEDFKANVEIREKIDIIQEILKHIARQH